MLLYKDGRLHYANYSFLLPNNFYIDMDPDLVVENTIYLISQDETFKVELSIQNECETAKEELKSILTDMKPINSATISSVTANNFTGWHSYYVTEFACYYEAWFDLDSERRFSFLITSKKPFDIAMGVSLLTEIQLNHSSV